MKIDDLFNAKKANYKFALELQDELLSSYYGEQLHISIHKTDLSSNAIISKSSYTLTVKSKKLSIEVVVDSDCIILYKDILFSPSKASYISEVKSYKRGISKALEEILYLFVYDATYKIITNSSFHLLNLGLDYYCNNKLYITNQIKFNEIQSGDYVMVLYKAETYFNVGIVLNDKVKIV